MVYAGTPSRNGRPRGVLEKGHALLDILTQADILLTYHSIDGPRDLPEGAVYRFDRRGHELLRIVRGVDPGMVAAVAGEPVEIALVIEGPLVVLCSKVGRALPWAGASYQGNRVRDSERLLPTTAFDAVAGSRVELILLEAEGGRVRGVRPLTLPAPFAGVLHEAILDQARSAYDPGEERRAMEALLRRCPTPDALVGIAPVKVTLKA